MAVGKLGTWAKHRKITVDNTNIDSNLTHFAVPIPIGTAVGQSARDVSSIFDEVGPESLKVAVTKADGTTQIYAEVEQWDSVNERALLWVSKSDLTITASGTTELYIYYDSTQPDNTTYIGTPGNRPEVWNSAFAARYGMAQDPTGGAGCIKDSSSNGNHGTPGGSMTGSDLVDGQIGRALDFDGTDDYIEVPSDPSLDVTSADGLTFQVVIYPTDGSGKENLIARDESGDREYVLRIRGLQPKIEIGGSEVSNANTDATLNAYNYIGFTLKAGDITWYSGGTADGTSTTAAEITASDNALQIARRLYSSYYEYYQGLICEVRLLSGVRSEAFFKADYYAQTDNLLTWGPEEINTPYEISGVVTESGTPVERTVRLYKRSDGSLVEETTSDYEDGSFLFDGITNSTIEYYVVALDDVSDETDYNALIYDRIVPIKSS